VAVLALVGQLAVQRTFTAQEDTARRLADVSRQRLLGQRLVTAALALAQAPDAAARAELAAAVAEGERLQQRGPAGEPVGLPALAGSPRHAALLAEMVARQQVMLRAAAALLAGDESAGPAPDGGAALARLLASEPAFRAAADALIAELERDVATRLHGLRQLSLALFGISLLALVLGGTGFRLAVLRLRQSEARFQALVQHVADVIAVVEDDGTLHYVSSAAERVLGYQPAELTGRDGFASVHPDDRARARQAFAQALARPGQAVTTTFRFRHRDGHWVHLETVGTNGVGVASVRGVVVAARDIGARRRAEARQATQLAVTRILAEAPTVAAALPRLLRAIGEGLGWDLGEAWWLDRQTDRLRWQAAWHAPDLDAAAFIAASQPLAFARGRGLPGRVLAGERPVWLPDVLADLGFQRRELAAALGLHGACAVPVHAGHEVQGALLFFSRAAAEPEAEWRVLLADLGWQIGQFSARRAAEAEREEMLRQARAAEARFRALLVAAPDAVITVDGAGRIVVINEQTERLFGYTRAELLGQPVEVLLPERFHEQHRADRADYAAAPRRRPMGMGLDLQARRADGSEFSVEISLSPLQIDQELMVIAIVRDVSAQRRLYVAEQQARAEAEAALAALRQSQAQLVQSGKLAAIGTLAAGVAHELNQPLMVIRGQTQLLLAGQAGDRSHDRLRRIERQTAKMAAIIDHLRTFGRTSPDGPPQRVELNLVVEEALLLIGAQLRAHGVMLVLALDEARPTVLADANHVEQIVLNLLINARDAVGPAGGQVTIRTWASAATGHLTVADTGPGIATSVQAHLFEPFFTTKPVGEGTGLGLSISRQLARRWGGELTLANRPDQPGALAELVLPIAPAAHPGPSHGGPDAACPPAPALDSARLVT
jgi:PAS domain S-box-containing protein